MMESLKRDKNGGLEFNEDKETFTGVSFREGVELEKGGWRMNLVIFSMDIFRKVF
jgi:hypothetical protein